MQTLIIYETIRDTNKCKTFGPFIKNFPIILKKEDKLTFHNFLNQKNKTHFKLPPTSHISLPTHFHSKRTSNTREKKHFPIPYIDVNVKTHKHANTEKNFFLQ